MTSLDGPTPGPWRWYLPGTAGGLSLLGDNIMTSFPQLRALTSAHFVFNAITVVTAAPPLKFK